MNKGAIGATYRLADLSRSKIRERFEERFTARRMAQDYVGVYRSLIERSAPHLKLVADAPPSVAMAHRG